MRTIHQHLCGVIPPHILRHIADDVDHADLATRASASTTLERMQTLAARSLRKAKKQQATAARAKVAPAPAKRRNVYDAGHTQQLPGKLVKREMGASSDDVEVQEAFDGAGKTWDFFNKVYSRNSIDGKGLRLDSTVHYGKRFENAFWNGRQMVYGDGDGKLFLRFTSALDVIGHELTHGVTQYTAGLGYTNQTGALNEHLSDAFGIMVKQYDRGLTAGQSDWIIGAGLFGPSVNGRGIRSMAAPGTAYNDPLLGRDPQPAHMRNYVVTTDDNGGVHINSGIPNHAFYLAATALGGPVWDVVGRVWYASLSYLPKQADFAAFATITYTLAGRWFGAKGTVQRAVGDAWSQVGLIPTGLTPSVLQALWLRSTQRRTERAGEEVEERQAA
jgi:Zn-dependent metalloprotease